MRTILKDVFTFERNIKSKEFFISHYILYDDGLEDIKYYPVSKDNEFNYIHTFLSSIAFLQCEHLSGLQTNPDNGNTNDSNIS